MLGIEVGGVGPGREGEENVLQFAIGEESEGGVVASRAKEGCCKMSQPQKKADNQKIKNISEVLRAVECVHCSRQIKTAHITQKFSQRCREMMGERIVGNLNCVHYSLPNSRKEGGHTDGGKLESIHDSTVVQYTTKPKMYCTRL